MGTKWAVALALVAILSVVFTLVAPAALHADDIPQGPGQDPPPGPPTPGGGGRALSPGATGFVAGWFGWLLCVGVTWI